MDRPQRADADAVSGSSRKLHVVLCAHCRYKQVSLRANLLGPEHERIDPALELGMLTGVFRAQGGLQGREEPPPGHRPGGFRQRSSQEVGQRPVAQHPAVFVLSVLVGLLVRLAGRYQHDALASSDQGRCCSGLERRPFVGFDAAFAGGAPGEHRRM